MAASETVMKRPEKRRRRRRPARSTRNMETTVATSWTTPTMTVDTFSSSVLPEASNIDTWTRRREKTRFDQGSPRPMASETGATVK